MAPGQSVGNKRPTLVVIVCLSFLFTVYVANTGHQESRTVLEGWGMWPPSGDHATLGAQGLEEEVGWRASIRQVFCIGMRTL